MTSLLRNVLALAFLFVSSSALASEQWVQGRVVLRECLYAFDYFAEVNLSYRNYSLPWGTSVELIHGWGGSSWSQSGGPITQFDWANTQTLPVSASAPYTWSATVSSIISERNDPWWNYDQLQFVWKVNLPNGHTFYEKGNSSTWGYYTVSFSQIQDRPCTNGSTVIGTPTPLTVDDVEKW